MSSPPVDSFSSSLSPSSSALLSHYDISSLLSTFPGVTSAQLYRLASLFTSIASRNSSFDPSSPSSCVLTLSQVHSLLESFGDSSLTEFELSDLLLSSQRRSTFSVPSCDFPLFISLFTRCYQKYEFQQLNEADHSGIHEIEEDELKSLFNDIANGGKQWNEEHIKQLFHLVGRSDIDVSSMEIGEIAQQIDPNGKGKFRIREFLHAMAP